MVGFDKEGGLLNELDFAIAGAGSGVITRAICQPLDVIKIRFQLQVEPTQGTLGKYRSMVQAVHIIIKEEGVRALWKGHVPGQLLSIFYGIGQFTSFEVFTREAGKFHYDWRWTPLVEFTCGVMSGATATFCSFPFDFLRTRMVAQSEINRKYRNTLYAFISVMRDEGFLALYKGLWPSTLQIAPQAGIQFMCFKLFDRAYRKAMDTDEPTLLGSFLGGCFAGLCAKTAVYPLDVVKKRLQVQGFEQDRQMFGKTFTCTGFNDCFVKTYKVEGIKGFFKGMYPSVMKAILATALHFSMYDMICSLLEKGKKKKRKQQ